MLDVCLTTQLCSSSILDSILISFKWHNQVRMFLSSWAILFTSILHTPHWEWRCICSKSMAGLWVSQLLHYPKPISSCLLWTALNSMAMRDEVRSSRFISLQHNVILACILYRGNQPALLWNHRDMGVAFVGLCFYLYICHFTLFSIFPICNCNSPLD